MIHVRADHISFIYPEKNIQALNDVSFCVQRGEYIAVLGANGSGKSTLARILAGFLPCTEGSANIEVIPFTDLEEDVSVGVPAGIVFQSPRDQIVAETLGADTAFGPENIGLPFAEIEKRKTECLHLVGFSDLEHEKTSTLSLGQKQKLALAGILALKPSVLILDEPVSMTDPDMRKNILDFLAERHRAGFTIIHVTHDADEALCASRVIVLDKGCLVFNGTPLSLRRETSLMSYLFPPLSPSVRAKKKVLPAAGRNFAALSFSNLDFAYTKGKPVFTGFSLDFYEGKLTALVGPSGSGKSTLFELASGLLKPIRGSVSAKGCPVLALQETESALFEEFAADDVAFGLKNQGLSGRALRDRVRRSMDMCGMPFDSFADRKIYTLSGGEKRKLALAGITALESEVYLFDEPTAGLDQKSRVQILHILKTLSSEGKTVVFSTHRREEADFADICIDLALLTKTGGTAKSADTRQEQESASKTGERTGTVVRHSDAILPLLDPVPLTDTSFLDTLRRSSSGLYKKRNTFLHRMPALPKIGLFAVLFIFSLCIQHIGVLSLCTVFALVYCALSRFPLIKLCATFFKFLPWLLLFAFFQFLLFPFTEGERLFFSWGRFSITPSKLSLAVNTLLHTAAALSFLTGFMHTTAVGEMLDGLKKLLSPLDKAGIKSKYICFTFATVFRFVPLLAEQTAQIIKIQLIRGGLKKKTGVFRRFRSLLPLFVPLIVQSLRRAEAFAETLEARYF